jgi:menaquinol-cytochrome c reductase iron-sulfur subunit
MLTDQPLTEKPTRRTFYVAIINLLGAAITAAVALPAAVYLLAKPKNTEGGDWVEVADINQLRVGKPEEIRYNRRRTDGWQKLDAEKATTWVIRQDDNKVVAFTPACTHLACPYHWDDSKMNFVCPCHGSMFSADGKVLAGPASRPLDRYISKVEAGKILIGPQIEKTAG